MKSADVADSTKLYVAAGALIQLMAAGATQLPVKELVKVAKNLLL